MEDDIAVDPDFYSLTKEWEPEDFESSPSDEQQFEAFEIGLQPRESSSSSSNRQISQGEGSPFETWHLAKFSAQHILDIGTGKGSWAIDVADKYPSATVRGIDIFPPPVTWVPPNCVFEVDDILQDWTWKEPFDFIHLRLLLGAFTPEGWDELYKKCYDALTPGAWIEQVELDVRLYSDDNTLKEDSYMGGWGNNFIGCSERSGRSLLTQESMRGTMEKAGFVDVHEVLYKIPVGPWPRDKLLKETGRLQYLHWTIALEGWAMWLLTKFGAPSPWSSDEVQVYLTKVRSELRNPHVHAYEYARRVWARKPTEEEARANIKVEPQHW
ncbi:unnamed protein product [Penicillium salamii]|nr:unnamed protein product [Penicillium salamii]CAG8429729.1 unnamed protein product [Penicillium salamii]